MNIHIIAVGKCKEKYWTEAVGEYLKRLSRYAKVDITEIRDEKTPDDTESAEARLVKEKEGRGILSKIPDKGYAIAAEISGERLTSSALSEKLACYGLTGKSDLYIVLGGSLGLSDEVLKRCDEKWSFSDMTFPHQLARVILLEQLYRGFRILRNEPYNK